MVPHGKLLMAKYGDQKQNFTIVKGVTTKEMTTDGVQRESTKLEGSYVVLQELV